MFHRDEGGRRSYAARIRSLGSSYETEGWIMSASSNTEAQQRRAER
jgi:hypothetical protein